MTLDQLIQKINNIELDESIEPMRTGKSRAWGGAFEYNWVVPAMSRHVAASGNPATDPDKKEWCEQMFGKSGYRWFENHNKFYFKNEEDMTMFLLRWS